MEVLNLATKEKQDEILGNFPIDIGFNLLNTTPVVVSLAMGNYSAYATVIEITGEGVAGMCVASSNAGQASRGSVRITVDGTVISEAVNFQFNQGYPYIYGSTQGTTYVQTLPDNWGRGETVLPYNIAFKQSFKVEAKKWLESDNNVNVFAQALVL